MMLLAGCAPAEQAARARTSSPTATAGQGAKDRVSPTGRPATARPKPEAAGTLPIKALSALPPEAGATWRLIVSGGPFPYSRDGVVFQNRERRLPARERGYYHEYTVPTPGSRDRGARRLISGGGTEELYYTGDHYRSFVIVDVRR